MGGAGVEGTVHFLSTIFFGETEDYFISPLGDASFRDLKARSINASAITASSLTTNSLTTNNLTVTESQTVKALNADFLDSLDSTQLLRSDLTGKVTSFHLFDGTITNSDIAVGAAIAYAKLNLGGSIVGADLASNINLSTTGAITSTSTSASSFSGSVSIGGTLSLSDGSASAPSLTFTNDTNTGLFRASADTLAGTVGGVERLRLETSTWTTDSWRRVAKFNSDVSSGAIELSSTAGGGVNWGIGNNGFLRFFTASDDSSTATITYRMVIDNSNGNVGIGTASPSTRLDTNLASSTTLQTTMQQNIGNHALAISTTQTDVGRQWPGLVWYTTDNNSTKPKLAIWGENTASGSNLIFGTSNDFATGVTNTAMYINASGNVGIGTTSPSVPLHVKQTSGQAMRIEWSDSTSSENRLGWFEGSTAIAFINTRGTTHAETGQMNIGALTASGALGFYTNATERWKINSSGHLLATTDNSFDIGASGATRPRTLYIASSAPAVVIGTNPATVGVIRLPNDTNIYGRNAANTANVLIIGLNSSNNVQVDSNFIFNTDNTFDIGASGTTRPRHIFAAGRITQDVGSNFLVVRGTAGSPNDDPVNQVQGELYADTTSDTFVIQAFNRSTGARKNVAFQTNVVFRADNTYDIGASGANRPRNIYAVGCAGAGGLCTDIAENYPTAETVEPGDLVAFSPLGGKKVMKAYGSFDAIGIVSSTPGVTLGEGDGVTIGQNGLVVGTKKEGEVPVALAGRVPTKISTENGEIKVGDYLTSSGTKPGYAIKATKAGRTIGIALEPFGSDLATQSPSSPATSKIMVFVNPSWYSPGSQIDAEGDLAQTNADGTADKVIGDKLLVISIEAKEGIFETLTATVEAVFEKLTAKTAQIAEAVIDNLIAKNITTDQLQLKDSSTGEIYCVRITDGDWNKQKGECSPQTAGN